LTENSVPLNPFDYHPFPHQISNFQTHPLVSRLQNMGKHPPSRPRRSTPFWMTGASAWGPGFIVITFQVVNKSSWFIKKSFGNHGFPTRWSNFVLFSWNSSLQTSNPCNEHGRKRINISRVASSPDPWKLDLWCSRFDPNPRSLEKQRRAEHCQDAGSVFIQNVKPHINPCKIPLNPYKSC
jgi:hypothetical protein